MQYRPEIDGLRAVAVVPVVLFHAKLGPFDGGYIGVDIFFVISGYLITSILLDDLEKGRFSILTFYERRARRILPALFLVMLVAIPPAYLWMFPLELNDFAQSLVATALFASNVLFWLESGYFEPTAELKPLLHTWSLAVEEQFYIIFPLLLFVVWRFFRRSLAWVLAAIIALSFATMQLGVAAWPDANFYLLPSRAWELLAGAACAVWLFRRPGPRSSPPAAALGGAMLLASLVLIDRTTPWPSALTLLPVLGTALVILFCTADAGLGRLLALKPVVLIGLISYSAYLWHQPIFTFARLRLPEAPTDGTMAVLICASFGLAWLSWRLVETPFRKKSDGRHAISIRRVTLAAFAGAGVFFAIGTAGHVTDGFPGRTAPSGLGFAAVEAMIAQDGSHLRGLDCDTDITFRPIPEAPGSGCIFPAVPEKGTAVIIGDSHATFFSPRLTDILTAQGYRTSVMTFGGCMPYPGFRLRGRDCDAANRAAYGYIKSARPDIVVLAARPQLQTAGPLQSEIERNAQTYLDLEFMPDAAGNHFPAATTTEAFLQRIESGVEALLGTGAKVIQIYPVPEARLHVGDHMRKAYAFSDRPGEIEITTPYEFLLERTDPVYRVLDGIEDPNFYRVRSHRQLCDRNAGICYNARGDQILYSDDNHLSPAGIELVLDAFARTVSELP